MLHVTDLAVGQEPEVGGVYLVPCLDLSRSITFMIDVFERHKKKMVAIPVLGHAHRDPEFTGAGGEELHIHVDMRFLTDWEFTEIWNTQPSYSNSDQGVNFPIVPLASLSNVPKPHQHPKMCYRKLADFRGVRLGFLHEYDKFQSEMERHTLDLENPVCPHHGTILKGQPVREGVLTCPLHGSTWCAKTGKYKQKPGDYNTPTKKVTCDTP